MSRLSAHRQPGAVSLSLGGDRLAGQGRQPFGVDAARRAHGRIGGQRGQKLGLGAERQPHPALRRQVREVGDQRSPLLDRRVAPGKAGAAAAAASVLRRVLA